MMALGGVDDLIDLHGEIGLSVAVLRDENVEYVVVKGLLLIEIEAAVVKGLYSCRRPFSDSRKNGGLRELEYRLNFTQNERHLD